jgi:hypothetical protein
MAKQLQPTSLIFIVLAVVIVAIKWAYDKGTNQNF